MTTSQLALFETPTPALREDPRDVTWRRAFSQEVANAIMAAAAARPGEQLGWHDFEELIKGYDISSCFGHAIYRLVREGKLLEHKHYLGKGIGAERPGSDNYRGYYTKWSVPV